MKNWRKKFQFHRVWKLALILLLSIFLGTILLSLVYCLPVEPMQMHMLETLDEFMSEGDNPFLIEGYKGSSLDNTTDALMLGHAVFVSELPAYKAAMLVQSSVSIGGDTQTSLQQYLETGHTDKVGNYARYWHGYLLLLKPLLSIMNFQKIRLLNGILTLGLFIMVQVLLYKRNMKKGMIAFLFSVLSLFPITISWSLQFSSVYYIGLFACLVVLWKYEYFEKRDLWIYFFFVVGICTSFIDFLTYPVFTFGMPLIICLVLCKADWKKGIGFAFKNGVCWSTGYLGMWAGKWTIGTFLTQNNIWKDAVGNVESRISTVAYGESVNRVMSVLRNLYIYFNVFGVLLAATLLFWVGIYLWKNRGQNCMNPIVLQVMIACIPIAWYLCTANHSYIHYWYTFRSLAVSVFAIGMIPEMIEGR